MARQEAACSVVTFDAPLEFLDVSNTCRCIKMHVFMCCVVNMCGAHVYICKLGYTSRHIQIYLNMLHLLRYIHINVVW